MRQCSCSQLSSHLFLALLFKWILFSFQRECAVWRLKHTEQEQMFTLNVRIQFVTMWCSCHSLSFVHVNVHRVLPVRDLAPTDVSCGSAGLCLGTGRLTNFRTQILRLLSFCWKAVAGARPHKPSSLSSYYRTGGGRLAAAVLVTSDLCVDGWKMMRWSLL